MPILPEIPDYSGMNLQIEDSLRQVQENTKRLAGRYDAGDIFNHLMRQVKIFQSRLDEGEEIGLKLANFGEAAQIHIRSIGYKDPNLIEFHGLHPDGHEVTLIQHISQLNFLLIAVKPIDAEPYRVGFGQR